MPTPPTKRFRWTPRQPHKSHAHNEADVQEELILNPPIPYTDLFCKEWEVSFGFPQDGVGDLVFRRPGTEQYLVVETKYLRAETGTRAKDNRNKGRKKVKQQALFYGDRFRSKHPQASVKVAIYTNYDGIQFLISNT